MVNAPLPGLYVGSTWHGRREPIHHDFRYRTWSVLVDLDRLAEQDRHLRLLRVGQRGLCSLRDEDHLLPLDAAAARAWLAERGVDLTDGHVSLLTSPRVFGYVFNPLSLWWCHTADGRLAAVVAEVHNTYSGRHAYLLRPDEDGRAVVDKALYVSPFFEVNGRYELRLRTDADRFRVHIGYERGGQRVFDATWAGRGRPLTDRGLAGVLLRHPLWTVRVSALIHWHGLRLWLRGLPVTPREPRHPGGRDQDARQRDARHAGPSSTNAEVAVADTSTPEQTGALLPDAPHAPVRAAALRALLRAAVPRLDGRLAVQLPGGEELRTRTAGPDATPRLVVHHPAAFHRLGTGGKLGLGESYMAGEWDADDLPGVLEVLARNTDRIPGGLWRAIRRLARVAPSAPANTLDGAARNVRHHYDLSNELFGLFLDDSMTYSCAVFDARHDDRQTLEDAQARKRALLLDALALGAGDHLLEIGTGWGSMAVHAAELTGCRVTTITLSREQAAYARDLVARVGFQDRIEVVVRDYREVTGRYDAVVSVEMLEAVGEPWWPSYFRTIARLLAPGGRAAVQTITMPHDRWQVARQGHGWIHRYIFPGGEIPSLAALDGPIRSAGLHVVAEREIGVHYVRTLQAWRERFLDHRADVHALGFDDTFLRMWEFYLAYCEAGFRTGRLGVSQLVLTPAAPQRHTASVPIGQVAGAAT